MGAVFWLAAWGADASYRASWKKELTPMTDDLAVFSNPMLTGIVQDMRELLSQDRVAFLLGAGCSKTAGLPLMAELTTDVISGDSLSKDTKDVLDELAKLFGKKDSANIEDYMSELVDHLSIVSRRQQRGTDNPTVMVGGMDLNEKQLNDAMAEMKSAISSRIRQENLRLDAHREFVQAVHSSLQAGKSERNVDYFVLNYDTLLEDALGLEQVHCFDGFTGSSIAWWEPSTFCAKEKGARVFKVHGSINWHLVGDGTLPKRIHSGILGTGDEKQVLIYPAATKYQEAQRDPFAQLLNCMRNRLRPGEGKELVLVVCGYSFNDSHIDSEIEHALRDSKDRLTVVAFTSESEPVGKLRRWCDDASITDQIRVYANNGFFHGRECERPEGIEAIPWWKFEVLSKLLKGERGNEQAT